MTVYLKLAGPNTSGLNPKGCFSRGWTDPAYKGGDIDHMANRGYWIGMRLDRLVVVDCDNEEAVSAWLAHIDKPLEHTWVRRTPHGMHFIYLRGSANVRAKVPWFIPKIDLKVGVGHMIVLHAPGYEDITHADRLRSFDAAWLPAVIENTGRTDDWSECPEGMGNNFLISVAGKLREWGCDYATILRCIASVSGNTMTTHPMPLQTLKNIAKSAAKYEPDERTTIECLACGAEMEVR